jgi:hypothetical protein
MSQVKVKRLGYLAAGVALLALFAAQGCGDDNNDQAAPTAGAGGAHNPNAGAGGKAPTSAGAGGKAPGNAGAGGKANPGGGAGPIDGAGAPGEGGEGGEAGSGSENCDGPDGCYSCTPKTNTQFLNHCVSGGCPATFDNSTLTKIDLVNTL